MKTKLIKRIPNFFAPLALMLIFMVFPYLWTFITSLKPSQELFTEKFHFFPVNGTLDNYIKVLNQPQFLVSMGHSLIVAVSTSLVTLVVALMAAYACSRFDFKGKRYTLMSFLLIHMFPPVLLLMPLFVTMKNFAMLDTFWSLIIAYCTFTIPFSVWLLTGYLNDIPMELEEAAIVDGCSRLTGFLKVILPLAAPGMVAATIYIFIYSWNEFLFATMLTGKSTQTLPITLYSFIGEHVINWEILTSGGILTGLPVILLFMLIQKKLVEGLTAGAVKG